jgi:hypothetical protein
VREACGGNLKRRCVYSALAIGAGGEFTSIPAGPFGSVCAAWAPPGVPSAGQSRHFDGIPVNNRRHLSTPPLKISLKRAQ